MREIALGWRGARLVSVVVVLAPLGIAHAQDRDVGSQPERVAAQAQDGTAPAAVPDAASSAEAQALFRRGLELGTADRWAEALELFRRSRALVSRPSTVFNIGFALFRLGHFVQAIASFDEYLALTETETNDLRPEAARRRGEAIASLATLTLELTPAAARLLVDGEESSAEGSPRSVSLDPGRHVLRASAEGYDEAHLEISVLAAERATRALSLTARIEEEAPPHAYDLLEDPVFWVITGALVVGAAVGIGVGASVASSPGSSYGGSTGVVLMAL